MFKIFYLDLLIHEQGRWPTGSAVRWLEDMCRANGMHMKIVRKLKWDEIHVLSSGDISLPCMVLGIYLRTLKANEELFVCGCDVPRYRLVGAMRGLSVAVE